MGSPLAMKGDIFNKLQGLGHGHLLEKGRLFFLPTTGVLLLLLKNIKCREDRKVLGCSQMTNLGKAKFCDIANIGVFVVFFYVQTTLLTLVTNGCYGLNCVSPTVIC